jgi:hypothetical protein
MTWWVCDELNRIDVEEMRKNLSGENAIDPANYLAWAIEQADSNRNMTPLRLHLPHLARFLHLPNRQGKRLPSRHYNPVTGAAADVKRIRKLWKRCYGRFKRTTDPTAEQIAADRWEAEIEAVINAVNRK